MLRDAGRRDAGPIVIDGGPLPTDGGPLPTDGGPTPTDGGPTPTDGGPTDGGPTPTDAGPVRTDAGPVRVDAGPVRVDAGPAPTDAGPPADCFDLVLGAAPASVTGSITGQGNDSTSTGCGGNGADVSYQFTATDAGIYTFDTLGSGIADTVLYVLGATCTGQLACTDDNATTGHSTVRLAMTAGQTVVVVVDAFSATTGNYNLRVATGVPANESTCTGGLDEDRDGAIDCADFDCRFAPSCDACVADTATAVTVLDPGGPEATGDTSAPGVQNFREIDSCGAPPGGQEEAFAFTAPASGWYLFDGSASVADYVLYLLQASCTGAELSCNADLGGSIVRFLTAGETVVVVVDTWPTAFGGTGPGLWAVDITTTAAPATASEVGDIFINEIMSQPTGGEPANEWFEVINSSGVPLVLSGCVISDTAGTQIIGAEVVVQNREAFVFARSATGGFRPDYLYGGIEWNNPGDTVGITCGGTLLDQVAYTNAFGNNAGRSKQLDPESFSLGAGGPFPWTVNDTATNWCSSPAAFPPYSGTNIGTPGSFNFTCP